MLNIMLSSSIQFSLLLNKIRGIYILHFCYPFIYEWMSRLIQFLRYYEESSDKHRFLKKYLCYKISKVLWVDAQEWYHWSYCPSSSSLRSLPPNDSHSGCTGLHFFQDWVKIPLSSHLCQHLFFDGGHTDWSEKDRASV